MAQIGGLGRGLSSLIPKRKGNQPGTVNYFGSEVSVSDEGTNPPANAVKEQDNSSQDKKTQTVAQQKNSATVAKTATEKEIAENRLKDISLKSIIEAPIESIVPNPHQPRLNFDERKLQELADSIKEHGVLQPLVVSRKDSNTFELIAGERRLEASKIAGLTKVPVVVRNASEQNKVELAVIENVQRHNLSVIEEAKAYKKMQDSFALTQEEIAQRVGKSRSKVANVTRLLKLPVEIQQAISEGKITEGHARTILAFSNPEKQRALFELILREKLNVREAEEKVRDITKKTNPKKLHSVDPEMQQKEQNLSENLGTKVKVKKGKKGGQIIVEFYSDEEFSALYNKLKTVS